MKNVYPEEDDIPKKNPEPVSRVLLGYSLDAVHERSAKRNEPYFNTVNEHRKLLTKQCAKI